MAATDSASPIKTWIKRHSPIKSRNKPLPDRPTDDGSPTKARARVPGRAVSGNASPVRQAMSPDKPGHKVAKRKISALWKHPQANPQHDPPRSKHRRVVSSPVAPQERPESAGSADSLSDRVSSLEAQLRAAKAELAGASHAIKHSSPWKSRPSMNRRTQSFESHSDIDRFVEHRQRSLLKGHHYDGVVESLLQPDYVSASRKAVSYSARGQDSPTRRSASAAGYYETAMAEYKSLEDSYTEEGESADALEMARRRSQLRATEWKRMQDHLAGPRNPQVGSKRSLESSSEAGNERPARRQKQDKSHVRDKALPELPRRERRATSESAGSRAGQAIKEGGSSQAHTIQYVQIKARSAEEPYEQPTGRCAVDEEKPEGAENVTVYYSDEDEEYAPPSPQRRQVPSPSRLQTVDEEFEWNDDEIF